MADSIAAPLSGALPDRSTALRPLLIASILAGTMMQAVDSTVANVALPHMQGSLQASADQITWVLTSYVIASAIMTAPVGWLAARFGRRNLYVVCLTCFTIASAACGAATSLGQMVVFRTLQGVFGAALSPLSQSMMFDLFPSEKRAHAQSLFGSIVMVGPILGPTLGGYLTDAFNWRWVFYINVPIGIAAVAGILLFPMRGMRNRAKRFDWMAFSFLGIGIGALQLMLDRGTSQDWFSSKEIWIETIVAGVGLYLFVVHLWTSGSEFVPHALLKDQNYMAGFLVIFFIAQLMLAGSVALAPYLENLGGYSVVHTGLLMSPRGVGTIAAILIVPFLVRKIDTRLVVGVGIVLTALSMRVMSSWTPQVSQTTIVFWMMVQGCSVGFLFGPVNLISFATLAPKFRTSGAAFVALARNLGGGIGISISTSLLARNAQVAHASMAAHVSPFNRTLDVGARSMFYNLHQPLGLSSLNQLISGQAQIIAYADGFLYLSTLSLFCLGALLLMRKVTLDFAAQKELEELMNE